MKIKIIGGGIAGLALGILLQQDGFDVEIFEKRPGIEPIGGGVGIWPIGSRVLQKMLTVEEIKQLAGNTEVEVMVDAEGNLLSKAPRSLFSTVNGSPILNVCRSELHQLLLEKFGANNVHFSMECVDVKNEAEKVVATFKNGQTVIADLLIGADGIYSTVRNSLFREQKLQPPELQYNGYVQLATLFKPTNKQKKPPYNLIWGHQRYCLTFSIGGGRYLFYHIRPLEQNQLPKERDEQMQLARGWSNEVDQLLDVVEQSIKSPEFFQHYYFGKSFDMLPFSPWHTGRIALLGEAAHPMGSLFAFGASLSLEDCEALTECLIQHPDNIVVALEKFTSRQQPRAEAFYKFQKKTETFLVSGSKEEYQHFLSAVKSKSSEQGLKALIDLLRGEKQENYNTQYIAPITMFGRNTSKITANNDGIYDLSMLFG